MNSLAGQVTTRPEHQGRFWQEWRIREPLRLRVDLTCRDACWGASGANRLKAAARLNAQLDYQVSPKLRLYVRGENINDDHTSDMYGFSFVGAVVYAGLQADW